jgi:hypothetical protein
MAQALTNEGTTNQPLLLRTSIDSDACQIWRPVFSPPTILNPQRLYVLYDIQAKTYFQFDIYPFSPKQIYTLSPQIITQQEADSLIMNERLLPQSLQDDTAAKAFIERFGLDATKVLHSVLVYHAVHDCVRISLHKDAGTLSLHEYYGTIISKKWHLPCYLNLLRPATDLVHRCAVIVLCADGIFFCGDCACFFKLHEKKSQAPFTQLEYLDSHIYLRIPVGKAVLSKPNASMVRSMLLESSSKNVRNSAYQHLGGIFKINFARTLPTVPVHVVLALLLGCCLFIGEKGDNQPAEDTWGPISFNEDNKLAEMRADFKVGTIDDVVMKKTLEQEHLYIGGIQCSMSVRFHSQKWDTP